MIKTSIIPLVLVAVTEFHAVLFYAPISNLHHIALDGKLTDEPLRTDRKKVLSCHMPEVILESNKEPQWE
jgi:hypothetical protein